MLWIFRSLGEEKVKSFHAKAMMEYIGIMLKGQCHEKSFQTETLGV